jgi:hypothetical protein
MKSWMLFLILLGLAGLADLYPNAARAGAGLGALAVAAPGCNAVAFTQVPDMLDLFVGRKLNGADEQNGCAGKAWSLDLLRMDWNAHRLSVVQTILQTPASILGGRARLDSAYDPYAAKFRGEYWVAFECAGYEIPGASACMGPFDPRTPGNGIDLSRTYIVVYGRSSDPRDQFTYSASGPKLLVFGDRLYLYWTAVKYWTPPGRKDHQWLTIATRGMELVQDPSGKRLLWGKGANGPVASYDPARNAEVWGVDPADPRSNQTADMFSTAVVGKVIYATAGLGGSGCLTPLGTSSGCYRLAISVSTAPLGPHAFNQHLVPEDLLPANPQEYTRLFRQPSGEFCLMGQFLKPLPQSPAERSLPKGVHCIPLPANSPILKFGETIAVPSRPR